ncbi:EscU/YscU/HrcU family type III secretion system export apparatus switch protein [Pseudomonas kielensis]|uniref:EscU/YscU/HrcU family type III secretion system export apparatus switch protein n=1 Tax=Pseudomonas kielensis TaxID=2762577 RepID=UPI0022408287|nr:EscU/YscU/HrcU family type III secretion system export apparatus switch protein [Pseudomonas kielensis]UZM16679.1 EscU/YscU/HrcU family type III secretion system export apparatus switch protein [Pseudomonas kielensis]
MPRPKARKPDSNNAGWTTPHAPPPRQAIALKYDGQHAPTLTGKGDDALPEAILKIAREHEVPIYENAELVRLLARMELGDSIPEELYRTIAEIIAFAWNLKGKFPQGHDLDSTQLEKDISHRGDDY